MLTSLGLLLVATSMARAAEVPADYRFKIEVLASEMIQPMELEVAPDGRIFFNELGGRLRIVKPGGAVVEAAKFAVFAEQENGLLGFALDPRFSENQWIYIFYSPTDFVGARISRFVMQGDRLDLGSEKLVLQFPEQRRECCHHAGSVEFAPDGCLLVSTGDNTHPGGDSDGYAPIDERPNQEPWDAQKSAANMDDLRGKILRIRPGSDGGYTIPDGNLFPRDGSRGRPEIYVMGCRNPWRMSVDSVTGIVYWGEVGPDAGGDGPRGSRGYDEINQAKRAGNFGWPYFVGNNFPYVDYDFATKKLGEKFDPAKPVNNSPNNTGGRELPPAQPALIYWPYGASKEFPELGQGGRTACAGPVFHFKPEFRATGGFPEHFDNCLLFWDWQRPFMKWARLDRESSLAGIEPFSGAVALANAKDKIASASKEGAFVLRRPIDAQFGPDGCLYLLDYGETWGVNADAKLIKISYQWGNIAPLAKASATPSAGREPLKVRLSSAGSRDLDGSVLKYEWRLVGPVAATLSAPGQPSSSAAPAEKLVATAAESSIEIGEPGNYIVELRVTDEQGASSRTTLPLVVGNSEPMVTFDAPQEGDFFTPGRPVSYKVSVRDAEDGSSTIQDELMDSRTFVSAKWSHGGGGEEVVPPGLALMKQSDCFNCHAVETKVLGPAFLDVASKYRGVAGAADVSAQRVIKGSSRVWSEVPMLPHASFTTDQVRLMVNWIFALEPGKGGAGLIRGLSGQLTSPDDAALQFASLEASYSDQGRGLAGPLTGHAQVKLRNRRVEAESADAMEGPQAFETGSASGKFALGQIHHGHAVRFARVKLSDAGAITCRVSSGSSGGRIELRADSKDGEVLASMEVQPTGGWEKWVELRSPLQAIDRRADLFVVFVNPGKSRLMNFDWIEFHPR